jgi:hypothetical protein
MFSLPLLIIKEGDNEKDRQRRKEEMANNKKNPRDVL